MQGACDFLRIGSRQGPLFAYPAGQESLRIVADPLIEQCCDLATNVGGVVQTRQFEALQGRNRSVVEKVPRRFGSRAGYGVPRCQWPVPYMT